MPEFTARDAIVDLLDGAAAYVRLATPCHGADRWKSPALDVEVAVSANAVAIRIPGGHSFHPCPHVPTFLAELIRAERQAAAAPALPDVEVFATPHRPPDSGWAVGVRLDHYGTRHETVVDDCSSDEPGMWRAVVAEHVADVRDFLHGCDLPRFAVDAYCEWLEGFHPDNDPADYAEGVLADA